MQRLVLGFIGLLWGLAALAVVGIDLLTDRLWNAEAGYVLVAAGVGGVWAGTIWLLRARRLHQPYRAG